MEKSQRPSRPEMIYCLLLRSGIIFISNNFCLLFQPHHLVHQGENMPGVHPSRTGSDGLFWNGLFPEYLTNYFTNTYFHKYSVRSFQATLLQFPFSPTVRLLPLSLLGFFLLPIPKESLLTNLDINYLHMISVIVCFPTRI